MVVAVTGYHGTGSSAVLDLLSEYEGCSQGGLRSYEHVPFYYPNGLFDLEHKLLLGNDPHRSDEAIKSFRSAMYELNDKNFGWMGTYDQYFGDEFKKNVDDFLESIIQFECDGHWYNYHQRGKFSLKKFFKDCVKTVIPQKQIIGEFGREVPTLVKQKMEISFVSEEEFFASAKVFVKNYLKMINRENVPTLLIDHLLFPHNAYRMAKYFDDDFRLIIVDRDVRDLFVLCKYIWAAMGFEPPYPTDAEAFLKHRISMKKAEKKTDNPNVLYINFEDLVYKYDETVAKIEKFVGLTPEQHLNPRTRFIPENSINNTQNFLIEKEWEEEVKIFEKQKDEIYDFPFERKAKIEDTFDNQE